MLRLITFGMFSKINSSTDFGGHGIYFFLPVKITIHFHSNVFGRLDDIYLFFLYA